MDVGHQSYDWKPKALFQDVRGLVFEIVAQRPVSAQTQRLWKWLRRR